MAETAHGGNWTIREFPNIKGGNEDTNAVISLF